MASLVARPRGGPVKQVLLDLDRDYRPDELETLAARLNSLLVDRTADQVDAVVSILRALVEPAPTIA